MHHDGMQNPELGLRSIRLSLRNLPLFRTQLRAVLRASALGNVSVMFPLVTTLQEVRQGKMVIADVMEDLEEEGISFNRNIPIGIMVEVPATVIMLDAFLNEVDFISVGTNDLIQYALAVDRTNKEVASLYDAGDPAVLRLIQMAVRSAQRAQRPVTMCGQMSGATPYTMLLVGLGFRSLSVAPSAIPEIKKICRSVTVAQCEAVAEHALRFENATDVNHFLKAELRNVAPELAAYA
jgi:phosphotransferase system enzyme I (PtsI)